MPDSRFEMDPRLVAEARDGFDLPLCRVNLRDEARWPWVVLVPRRAGLAEVFDLLPGDGAQLWSEVTRISSALKAATSADKINIAQFGNVCRQLHIHIVARTAGDPDWPGGVVGVGQRESEADSDLPRWWQNIRILMGID